MIHQILNGDKEAFDLLVNKHYKEIYSYCYMRTNDVDDAADLTQEVFLKLVSSIYNYRFTGKFSNFLFTIAVNTCNDFYRKMKLETDPETDNIPSDSDTPLEAVVKNEEKEILLNRLNSLPDIQKEAILLHYIHGFKVKDVAKITGVSLPTAKSRIKQGLDKLRKIYQGDD